MTAIDPTTFKDMMSAVAQTVTVVTTNHGDEPIGLTVSAFVSVSASPPIVLVCIDKAVSSLDAFEDAAGYTVNFLPDDAADVAMVFATHGLDRFALVATHPAPGGVGGPVLDIAYGHFECRLVHRLEMGDHWVFFGEVIGGGRDDEDIDPLVWLKRSFRSVEGPSA